MRAALVPRRVSGAALTAAASRAGRNLGGVPGHVISVKMAAVDRGPGDAGTAYRVNASTQVGSVRVSVPRAAASSHVIEATTGTGTVTVTGS